MLGEYSKLLTNLRIGLEENGIKVTHVHEGDHKKNISGASFNIGTQINNKFQVAACQRSCDSRVDKSLQFQTHDWFAEMKHCFVTAIYTYCINIH